jgi:hypothetical protein
LSIIGASVYLGSQFRSPAEVAVQSAAPVQGPLTAVVERRVLEDVARLDCTIVSESKVPLTIAGATEGSLAVVTSAAKRVGELIGAGETLAEVAGRPVFVLPGDFPLYRDVKPGLSGPDVKQLQAALRSLGYRQVRNDTAGTFGPPTQLAVEAFYKDRGHVAVRDPSGVIVPRVEVVFVPVMPARLATSSLKVGSIAEGTVATLASGALRAECPIPLSMKAVTFGGQPARAPGSAVVGLVLGPVASSEPAASGAEPGATPGSAPGGAGGQGPAEPKVAITLDPATAPGGVAIQDGQTVVQEVVLQATPAPVLVVPLVAVGGPPDAARVTVMVDGTNREVNVTVGMTAGGYAEVTPEDGGMLAEGDTVVIG